jgi:hypothetical protein
MVELSGRVIMSARNDDLLSGQVADQATALGASPSSSRAAVADSAPGLSMINNRLAAVSRGGTTCIEPTRTRGPALFAGGEARIPGCRSFRNGAAAQNRPWM